METYLESFEFGWNGKCDVLLHHPHRLLKVTLQSLIRARNLAKPEDRYIEVMGHMIEYRLIPNITDSKFPILVGCLIKDSLTARREVTEANGPRFCRDSFILSMGEYNKILQTAKSIAIANGIPLDLE
jgi:hypothetical protein